jgi:hypothetical protein
MKRIKILALTAFCGLAGFKSLAVGIPVDNFGSYAGPGFTTISSPNTFGQNSGWTVSSGSIDQIGGYWVSPNSFNTVDLDGDSPGSIQTTIDVPQAGTVTVDFELSGNPDGTPTTKTLSVDLGTAPAQTSTYTLTGANSHSSMDYVEVSDVFNVGAGDQVLSFASLDVGSPFGPVVGAVCAYENSSVPDGGTTALLLGMSFAGFACIRRKLG